ncbi:MAG: PIN domain-containing protein, partial [Verrucomicrobiales bacterium]
LAAICHRQPIYFLGRPLLPDPKDDMVLELAIASSATHIITFNRKDFSPASRFGITIISPGKFLALIP